MEILVKILAVVGGGGVVIIALWKLLSDLFQDELRERSRRRSEVELEARRQRYGLRRVQADKYAQTQFDKYVELWQSLQALKFTVDALWRRATQSNVDRLAGQLDQTTALVADWSIFFEQEHLRELDNIFAILKEFEQGKRFLFAEVTIETQLRLQVEANAENKAKFETLLQKLKQSFQNRLSSIEKDEGQPVSYRQ